MRDFNSQHLGNTAWAFATVGHKEERLFTALAAAAERRMRDFNSQDLANTAWAFTTVGHKGERLFSMLAAAVEQRMKDFRGRIGLVVATAAALACRAKSKRATHGYIKEPEEPAPVRAKDCFAAPAAIGFGNPGSDGFSCFGTNFIKFCLGF